MVERTVIAAEVFSTYAPPALIFLHAVHAQMPTAAPHGVLAAAVDKNFGAGTPPVFHNFAEEAPRYRTCRRSPHGRRGKGRGDETPGWFHGELEQPPEGARKPSETIPRFAAA